MKFYPQSRAIRIVFTVLCIATAICGAGALLHHRWLLGSASVFLGTVYSYSLWTCYWEIEPDGMLRAKGYGFNLMFPVSELCYAGPVKGEQSFSISKKKHIEFEFAGVRAMQYARVRDRMAFLQQLQRVAPQAEIILF